MMTTQSKRKADVLLLKCFANIVFYFQSINNNNKNYVVQQQECDFKSVELEINGNPRGLNLQLNMENAVLIFFINEAMHSCVFYVRNLSRLM